MTTDEGFLKGLASIHEMVMLGESASTDEEARQSDGHSLGAPRRETHGHFVGKERDTEATAGHTPGPWKFDPTNDGATSEQCYGIIQDNDRGGWSICFVPVAARGFEGDWDAAEARAKADAALIAQAPDLRADVTRLKGERDAARTALVSRSQDVHLLSHQGEDQRFELEEDGWQSCILNPCVSDAALAKGGGQ